MLQGNTIFNEAWNALEEAKSAHAYVNKLACTCTKGVGPTLCQAD